MRQKVFLLILGLALGVTSCGGPEVVWPLPADRAPAAFIEHLDQGPLETDDGHKPVGRQVFHHASLP